MNAQSAPDLKALFKQAAEIAKQVPESMQEAAFNRALDLLTAGVNPNRTDKGASRPEKIKKQEATSGVGEGIKGDSLEVLLSSIDSTQYPEIISANKVIDCSLMVLQIALKDHGIDGLSPAAIARVLTDKFRRGTNSNAVTMALGRATNLVNRVPDGRGFLYRIMGPGEKYLHQLGDEDVSHDKSPVRRVGKKRAAKKRGSKKAIEEKPMQKPKGSMVGKSKGSGGQKKSKTTGVGPKATILKLIESGFFSKGRTAPDIQMFLKQKRGLTFEVDALRLTMLRLLREEKLDREENAEGQYEYKATKP